MQRLVEIADDSGRLKVVFFNQSWRAQQLAVGTLAGMGSAALLTDRTVFDNLHFVLEATGWKNDAEMKTRIREVLSNRCVATLMPGWKLGEIEEGDQVFN